MEALTKDACLIEASNACEKAPISSLDNKMRSRLRACADWVPEIKGVVWLNPANAKETLQTLGCDKCRASCRVVKAHTRIPLT
jgi:hypothetical protein